MTFLLTPWLPLAIDLSTSPFICNESTPTSADGVVPDNNIPSQATQGAYQEPLPYYSNVEPAPPCWPIPRGHIVSPWEPYGFDREDIYHGTRPETGLLLPTITPTLADQTVPGDKLVFDPRGRSWCNYENHKDQWLGTANWHLYDRNYLIPPFHEWTEHCPKVKDWKVCDCETCEEDGVGVYAPGYWEWKERQDRLAEEELPWLEDEVEACDCGEVEEDQGKCFIYLL